MHKQKISILVGISLVVFVSTAHAGNWQNSWSSEKSAAAQRCAKTFTHYPVQALCMDTEKDGYDKMQKY
jgi:cytochrome oxidase assembly protein ShyY1